jgi:hypothetical protein
LKVYLKIKLSDQIVILKEEESKSELLGLVSETKYNLKEKLVVSTKTFT